MALWMPYAEDAALDLSKPAVKEEKEFVSSSSDHSTLGHTYPPYYPLPIGYPTYYPGYPYPAPAVTSIQMSPISGDSTCSGCDQAPIGASPSPVLAIKSSSISPPVSPVSQAPRSLSYMDEDALSDDPDFQAFERDAMRAMAEKNGGALLGNNPRMRRAVKSTNQDSTNDSYRKQRERNNFAAKQSRDRRKLREIHLALKVSYLKNEIARLKTKLVSKVCTRCQQMCSC